MAEVAGFEPANSGIKTHRLTNLATPLYSMQIIFLACYMY